MDAVSKTSCLEEISTLVFDSLEKVTLKTISNNWSISNKDANEVLVEWLNQNCKKDDIVPQFLVQGFDSKGIYCVSIVPEDGKKTLEEQWKSFKHLLYSIEVKTTSRTLDLPDYESIKVKNILLNSVGSRDLSVPIVKIEPTNSKKVEQKAKSTPFIMSKPAVKVEAKKSEPKVTIKQSPPKSPAKKVESPPISSKSNGESIVADEIKTEKKSPVEKAGSKTTANKKTQLKNQKPVQKGSISSFFNNKPGTSKPPMEKPKLKSPEVLKQEMVVVETKAKQSNSKTRKRSSSSDDVVIVVKKKTEEKKKPAAKKIKLKELPNNKRSRIRVMQDSSDEEEETKEELDEPDTKFIKFDREATPDRESSPDEPRQTPEKKVETAQVNKHKAKRMVTKRFADEEGFMRTERVLQEYSASEEENDENLKKNSSSKSDSSKKNDVVVKKSTEKKQAVKSKLVQAPKTKQGNIASFFNKK